MKCLIVDNRPEEDYLRQFVTHARERAGWDVRVEPPMTSEEAVRLCSRERPDVILIDVALSEEEEGLLNGLTEASAQITDPLMFTGMRLCAQLSSALAECPVGILTKGDVTNLASCAFLVGARFFFVKRVLPQTLVRHVESFVRSTSLYDAALHDALSKAMGAGSTSWRAQDLRPALDGFFRARPPEQRFGMLCARMAPVLSEVLSGYDRALDDAVAALVETHDILRIADGTVRDHGRHSGNVLWLGYCILNSDERFRECALLPGFTGEVYGSGDSSARFEDLNRAWIVAALFHDIGYVDEKRSQVEELLVRLYPSAKRSKGSILRGSSNPMSHLGPLVAYLRQLGGPGTELARVLVWMRSNWGKRVGNGDDREGPGELVQDHGLLSAARLLQLGQVEHLAGRARAVLLHATAAVAMHNLPRWLSSYPIRVRTNQLPMGFLPVASLLGLCDLLQTWDRESTRPPRAGAGHSTSAERIAAYRRAYVVRSEVAEFALARADCGARGPLAIQVGIRYLLRYGDEMEEVCNDLAAALNAWFVSGDGRRTMVTFGLAGCYRLVVRHMIPNRREAIEHQLGISSDPT